MINKKLLYASGFFLIISVYFALNLGCLLSDNYLSTQGMILAALNGNIQIGIKNIEYTNKSEQKTKISDYKCKKDYTIDAISFNLKDTLCEEAKNSIIPTYIFISIVLILGFIKVYFISKGKKNIYLDIGLTLSILAIIVMNSIIVAYIVQLSDRFIIDELGADSSFAATFASLAVGGIIFIGLLIEVFYNVYNKKYN